MTFLAEAEAHQALRRIVARRRSALEAFYERGVAASQLVGFVVVALVIALGVARLVETVAFPDGLGRNYPITTAAVIPVLFTAAWLRRRYEAIRASRQAVTDEPVEMTADRNGIILKVGSVTAVIQTWQGIESVEQDDGYVALLTSSTTAYLVPKTSFPAREEADRFAAFAARQIRHRSDHPVDPAQFEVAWTYPAGVGGGEPTPAPQP